jgi:5-formyltetrahydrofolate cyclo-ligase
MSKAEFREICRSILKGKSKLDSYGAGLFLLSLLKNLIPNNSRVSCFISHRGEVSTNDIILQLYSQNCQVLVPTWNRESMWMVPLSRHEDYLELIRKYSSFYKEKYGHTIPIPDNKNEVWNEIDFCIVPGFKKTLISKSPLGLGFFELDGKYYRIGHGYGYYDKYFANYFERFKRLSFIIGSFIIFYFFLRNWIQGAIDK